MGSWSANWSRYTGGDQSNNNNNMGTECTAAANNFSPVHHSRFCPLVVNGSQKKFGVKKINYFSAVSDVWKKPAKQCKRELSSRASNQRQQESYTTLIEQLENMSMIQNRRSKQVQWSPTKPADVTVPKLTICWSEQASIINNSYRIYARERLEKSPNQYLMNSAKEKLDSLSNSIPTSARNRRVNSATICTSKSTANCCEAELSTNRNFPCCLISDITDNYTTPADSTCDNNPPGTKQTCNVFQKSHFQQLNLDRSPEFNETEKASFSNSLYPENDASSYSDILPTPFVSMNFNELMDSLQWKTFLSITPNEQLQQLINRLLQMEKMQFKTIEIEKCKVNEGWLSTPADTCPVNRVKMNRKFQNDHFIHITSFNPADCLQKSANQNIQNQNSHHIGSWDLCNYSLEPQVFKSQYRRDCNVDEHLNRATCGSSQLTLEEPFSSCASTEAIVAEEPVSIDVSANRMALEEPNLTYVNSEALGKSTSSSDSNDVIILEGSTSTCASTEVVALEECMSCSSSTETTALETPISSQGSTKDRVLEEPTSSHGISEATALAIEEPISNYGNSKATTVKWSILSYDNVEAIALKEPLSSNPSTKAIASQKLSLNYESSEGTSFKEPILNCDSAEATASKKPLSRCNSIETIALENTTMSGTSTEAKIPHIPALNFENRKGKTKYRSVWICCSADVKTRCRPAWHHENTESKSEFRPRWNYGIIEAKTESRLYGNTEPPKDHRSAANFRSTESKGHRPPGDYRITEIRKDRPAWNYGNTESKKDQRPVLSYGKTEAKTECIPAWSNGSTEAKTTGSCASTQVTAGVKPVKSPPSSKSSHCSGKDNKKQKKKFSRRNKTSSEETFSHRRKSMTNSSNQRKKKRTTNK